MDEPRETKEKEESVEEDIGCFQASVFPSVKTNGIMMGWCGQTALGGRFLL